MAQMPLYSGGQYLGSVDSTVVEQQCRHRNLEPYPPKDCHSGCCDGKRCRDCGLTFRVECPD